MRVEKVSATASSGKQVLKSISFMALPGEIICIIGKSGAGKSSLLKAISSAKISVDIKVKGVIAGIDSLGFLYQDGEDALSPAYTILAQAAENVGLENRAIKIFKEMDIKDKMRSYGAFLSGGQVTRSLLAINLHQRPKVLLLDEATRALDPQSQERFLSILTRFADDHKAILLWVTHDLSLIAKVAHRVLVIDDGRLVEDSMADAFLVRPESVVGRQLLGAKSTFPAPSGGGARACSFSNVSLAYGKVPILSNLSFCVHKGETLGIFGGSGAGKTTILRAIIGQIPIEKGTVCIDGSVQMIFQNARSSLDPKMSIFRSVAEPLWGKVKYGVLQERVHAYLQAVGIDTNRANSLPEYFSGGECQRVCIARAMIAGPSVVLADEITASQDVIAIRNIVKILHKFQKNIAMICVSHDRDFLGQVAHKFLEIGIDGKGRFLA